MHVKASLAVQAGQCTLYVWQKCRFKKMKCCSILFCLGNASLVGGTILLSVSNKHFVVKDRNVDC